MLFHLRRTNFFRVPFQSGLHRKCLSSSRKTTFFYRANNGRLPAYEKISLQNRWHGWITFWFWRRTKNMIRFGLKTFNSVFLDCTKDPFETNRSFIGTFLQCIRGRSRPRTPDIDPDLLAFLRISPALAVSSKLSQWSVHKTFRGGHFCRIRRFRRCANGIYLRKAILVPGVQENSGRDSRRNPGSVIRYWSHFLFTQNTNGKVFE